MTTFETVEEVTPEIIAQAEKLGYHVGYLNPSPGPFDHLFITARPLHSPLAIGAAFQLGPFDTEGAVIRHLPEIVRCHVRAAKLTENYSVGVRESGRENAWFVFHPSERGAGPFDNPTAALDEAERLADKSRRIYEGRIEYARQEYLRAAQIPLACAGIDLGNFDAKTTTLKAALEATLAWTKVFQPHGEYIQNLWLCGPVGKGKTTLACAAAATLAKVGRSALYCTVAEAIQAPEDLSVMNKLRMPELLVLDWTGLTPTGNRASRDQSELLGIVSGRSVGPVLDARYEDNRPTLLVADCDQAKLQRCLGNARFERLQRRKIVDF